MRLQLMPVSTKRARDILLEHDCLVPPKEFDFAVAVLDSDDHEFTVNGGIHGLIAMYADGSQCGLAILWTDGTELVGSILYGAAWRAAKALGYKQITL